MLLSVIVPVYNAGEYLQPCIQSILDLSIEKEVIVVDDGSTDEAVERLAISDTRLTIVHQSNQGVSAARNTGLKMAQGEWIWFCDADDRTLPNYNLNQKRPEAYDTLRYENENLLVLPSIWEEKGVAKRFEAQEGEIPYNLWRCWFRREEIERQDLRFTVGRKYGEDQEFILNYLLRSGIKIQALDGPVYHYTMRASGAMMQAGIRSRQKRDLCCVLFRFIWNTLVTGNVTKSWTIKQIKRIIKNIIII